MSRSGPDPPRTPPPEPQETLAQVSPRLRETPSAFNTPQSGAQDARTQTDVPSPSPRGNLRGSQQQQQPASSTQPQTTSWAFVKEIEVKVKQLPASHLEYEMWREALEAAILKASPDPELAKLYIEKSSKNTFCMCLHTHKMYRRHLRVLVFTKCVEGAYDDTCQL